MRSLRFQIRGTVQGVGFRPWVYRLAHQLDLKGFVRNTSQGVCIEIEGPKTKVDDFVQSDTDQTAGPLYYYTMP